jgi:hypothetical protein
MPSSASTARARAYRPVGCVQAVPATSTQSADDSPSATQEAAEKAVFLGYGSRLRVAPESHRRATYISAFSPSC